MEFKHRYGAVELYLQEEEDGPQIWARYAGAVRQGVMGPYCDTTEGVAPRQVIDIRQPDPVVKERELCVYQRRVVEQDRYGDEAVIWIRRNGPNTGRTVWRSDWERSTSETARTWADECATTTPFNPDVLEAAATLLLDDYWAFQEADRAMGDPNP